jgi:hypothetical protein
LAGKTPQVWLKYGLVVLIDLRGFPFDLVEPEVVRGHKDAVIGL